LPNSGGRETLRGDQRPDASAMSQLTEFGEPRPRSLNARLPWFLVIGIAPKLDG
jgi:hypothetical protein